MEKDDESFWSEGSFAQPMSSDDWEKKKRTFHMKHDGMCDKRFNDAYFRE